MSLTKDLSKIGSIANALYSSITANTTAITSINAAVVDINTGTAIASASTIDLNTATGNRVHITGTTTITAVTLTRGPRTVIFDDVLTLTHNATTNNLPGAANITTAAGDRAIYESDGTTVYCVNYIKVSGAAVVAAAGANPSATIGTAAVNGSASTFLRSDGAPAFGNLTGAVTSTGMATVLGSFTSANLAAALTDETGSGANVFAISPTLVTPALGTPSSGVASNMTVDGTDAVGFRNIPQNSQSAAYTLVLADNGKHIFHPASDANARTYTIPANASVAYPIGTAISFINMTSQVVTIAITTDTMNLSPAGTTGSRSLAQYGSATAIKITSTGWLISGSGLT